MTDVLPAFDALPEVDDGPLPFYSEDEMLAGSETILPVAADTDPPAPVVPPDPFAACRAQTEYADAAAKSWHAGKVGEALEILGADGQEDVAEAAKRVVAAKLDAERLLQVAMKRIDQLEKVLTATEQRIFDVRRAMQGWREVAEDVPTLGG